MSQHIGNDILMKIEKKLILHGCIETSEEKKEKLIEILSEETLEKLNLRINTPKLFNNFYERFTECLISSLNFLNEISIKSNPIAIIIEQTTGKLFEGLLK